MKDTIAFEDFAKVDIRMGTVTAAEVPEGSNKVIKLTVDFGEEEGVRTIFSGIKDWYEPTDLVGKILPFIINLLPKRMGNLGESQGMLVAAISTENGSEKAVLLEPTGNVKNGDAVV
jgi:methionyl-tRNA synthetase